jgi:rod shape determining protein RodA
MAVTPITDRAGDPPAAASASRPAGMALPVDLTLVLATLGLCVMSLLTIDAVTSGDIPGSPDFFVARQGLFVGIGLVVALVASRIDYSRLREVRHVVFGLLLVSLVAVFAFGSVTRGSQRAIPLGPIEAQPSELGKVLLCVVLAAFLVERSRELGTRETTARAMLLALVPGTMVMAGDLGSGLVFLAIAFAIMFVAGTPWRHLGGLLALGTLAVTAVLVVAPLAGVEVLKPYQEDRLTSFLHPTQDPGEAGYQQNQSRIAIGSGQKTGRGDSSTQTQLDFLPEHHTDFVFASVGERWGFAGAAFVLSLYSLLVWRGLRILTTAKDFFGALIAAGIVALFLFQLFVNVGMNVGIMPITGIPLPLLTYGGSSVISTFLAIGLLHSIYTQGRGAAAVKGRLRL